MKKQNNYAFIDSQNLNLGVRSQKWVMDYKKLRLYLKNKYNVEKAFIFIGMVANNQKLYTMLQSAGFILVFKPTVRYFKNGKETVKGNVDAELVLHAAAIEFNNYNQAIIISGDGDFACLMEYLVDSHKLMHIMTPSSKYSQLLRPFAQYIIKIGDLKETLRYQKSQHQRSVETLGLSGNGDALNIAKKGKKVNSPGKPQKNKHKKRRV